MPTQKGLAARVFDDESDAGPPSDKGQSRDEPDKKDVE